MKKVLALLLVLVLAIGMFAACGTDSGNNEETKDTANNATTEGGNDETKPSEENGNNTEGKTLKVGMICIGDENDQGYTYNFYRAKDSVTEKMAAKAIKYKRSMALEPMNSYERHVIHTALQDYEGVPRPAAMSSSATPMATSRTCSRLLPITPMCSSSAAPT